MDKMDLIVSGIIVLAIVALFGTISFGLYLDHIEEMAPYICMDS